MHLKKLVLDFIESNIRQRGIGNPNPMKLGRCIKELERIYGTEYMNKDTLKFLLTTKWLSVIILSNYIEKLNMEIIRGLLIIISPQNCKKNSQQI